MIAMIATRQQ